jgi:hypothetical protein
MAEIGYTEFRIHKGILTIGHQNYQLRNIARVQTVTLRPPPGANKGNGCLTALVPFLVFFFLVGPITGAVASSSASSATPIVFLLGLAGCGVCGYLVYRATIKRWTPTYALVLETTGNPLEVLASIDYSLISSLAGQIVDAMSNNFEGDFHLTIDNRRLSFGNPQGVQVNYGSNNYQGNRY